MFCWEDEIDEKLWKERTEKEMMEKIRKKNIIKSEKREYEKNMNLIAYIDMMDQIMESYDPQSERSQMYKLCLELGQNLFDRSYYTMTDSTHYLELWKYWMTCHGIKFNIDEIEYQWDHIFI